MWRGFQKPKHLAVEPDSLTQTYGRFSAQPFERGFGTTIGNSLRRALLSSIEGATITAVRIEGVAHEFSPLPGVTEDDILTAAALIFEPYPAAPHSVGIVGVRFDPDTGDPTVDWTKSKNGGSAPDALTQAVGLGAPGEGVVVVRVTYNYTPVFFDFVMSSATIGETAVLRPRRSSFVEGPTP